MSETYHEKARCPECGSENVSYMQVTMLPFLPKKWDWQFRCEECGHEDSGRTSRPVWLPAK